MLSFFSSSSKRNIHCEGMASQKGQKSIKLNRWVKSCHGESGFGPGFEWIWHRTRANEPWLLTFSQRVTVLFSPVAFSHRDPMFVFLSWMCLNWSSPWWRVVVLRQTSHWKQTHSEVCFSLFYESFKQSGTCVDGSLCWTSPEDQVWHRSWRSRV